MRLPSDVQAHPQSLQQMGPDSDQVHALYIMEHMENSCACETPRKSIFSARRMLEVSLLFVHKFTSF
jgi:hypothetical protein